MSFRFIRGARRVERKRHKIVRYEEDMYKHVAAKLLSSRGKVYMFKSIEGLVPDFLVDGGIWQVIVEVKTRISMRDLEQIETYSNLGEVCVAVPKNVRPRNVPCYVYIDALYIPPYEFARREDKRAGERGEEEVSESAEEVSG